MNCVLHGHFVFFPLVAIGNKKQLMLTYVTPWLTTEMIKYENPG